MSAFLGIQKSSPEHFLDSYSNPGTSHHQASKKDLLKDPNDVENKTHSDLA